MEQVTAAWLFEQLGRLYASREMLVAERDQAREQTQRFARLLEHRTEPNGAVEAEGVMPSQTT